MNRGDECCHGSRFDRWDGVSTELTGLRDDSREPFVCSSHSGNVCGSGVEGGGVCVGDEERMDTGRPEADQQRATMGQ